MLHSQADVIINFIYPLGSGGAGQCHILSMQLDNGQYDPAFGTGAPAGIKGLLLAPNESRQGIGQIMVGAGQRIGG